MSNVKRRAQLVDEMAQRQAQIDKIDEEQKELDAMQPSERIMHGLHDLLCRDNHTDGCGFQYKAQVEVRQRWLDKAEVVLKLYPRA